MIFYLTRVDLIKLALFVMFLPSCTDKRDHHLSPFAPLGSETSGEEWRQILTSYDGGGTTGLRQEQKRILTHEQAELYLKAAYEQVRLHGVPGESWRLRDVPDQGRVNGTVTDYLPKTADGYVVRIRAYTDRSVAGGEHQLSKTLQEASNLEIKIPVPMVEGRPISGVLRKPSVMFYNRDLALMLDGVQSLTKNRSEIVDRTFKLNKSRFEPRLIGAMIDKVHDVLKSHSGEGPLQLALSIQYERTAYAATLKDGTKSIDAQITHDRFIKYHKPAAISASIPYGGPYSSLHNGLAVAQTFNADHAIVELKVPVAYAFLYQENKEKLGRTSVALKMMMDQYSSLKNVIDVPLGSGKSTFFRTKAPSNCPPAAESMAIP